MVITRRYNPAGQLKGKYLARSAEDESIERPGLEKHKVLSPAMKVLPRYCKAGYQPSPDTLAHFSGQLALLTCTLQLVYVDGFIYKLMKQRYYERQETKSYLPNRNSTNILDDNVHLQNYNMWRKDTKIKQRGGGVMILTGKELQVKQIHANAIEMVELVAVEIKTKEGNIIVATVYMPS